MAETRKIIHIEAALSNLDNLQIGVESNNDADLGYRIWGGKDSLGNITKWLAKDQDARVDGLTITSAAGSAGILQHSAAGLVTGNASLGALSDVVIATPLDGQALVYDSGDSRWENTTINLTPTLDDCYNNDTGERSVIVDDGDIRFYLDDTNQVVRISMDGTFNNQCGFLVDADSGADYFRVQRRNVEGSLILFVETDDVEIDFACRSFEVDSAGTVVVGSTGSCSVTSSGASCSVGSLDSTSNLNLIGRNTSTPFNDASNLSLSGFTATSIIGALNELRALH